MKAFVATRAAIKALVAKTFCNEKPRAKKFAQTKVIRDKGSLYLRKPEMIAPIAKTFCNEKPRAIKFTRDKSFSR